MRFLAGKPCGCGMPRRSDNSSEGNTRHRTHFLLRRARFFTRAGLALLAFSPLAAQAQSYTLTLLGALPGGTYSLGRAVNAAGQVAGESDVLGGQHHAVLFGPGGVGTTDLGTLPGGTFAAGEGINDSGQVVGLSSTTKYQESGRAFLFENGAMRDLNSLIAPSSDFVLTNATGISNTGFITGIGSGTVGGLFVTGAFLLTPNAAPVPEGSTAAALGLLLLLLGLAAALFARRRAFS